MSKSIVKHSKFLSLILRHQPKLIGLSLDENGWADMAQAGISFFLSDNGVWLTDTVPSQYLDPLNVI
jgi:RNA:NAD 2'-phosphotransferase (TPT1/KptA family)